MRITSMTEKGYKKIISRVNNFGYSFPDEPQYKATILMISIAEDIFKKNKFKNEYESLFNSDSSEDNNEELIKCNNILKKLYNICNIPPFTRSIKRETSLWTTATLSSL